MVSDWTDQVEVDWLFYLRDLLIDRNRCCPWATCDTRHEGTALVCGFRNGHYAPESARRSNSSIHISFGRKISKDLLIFAGNGPAGEQACPIQFVDAPPTRWPRRAPSSTGLIVYYFLLELMLKILIYCSIREIPLEMSVALSCESLILSSSNVNSFLIYFFHYLNAHLFTQSFILSWQMCSLFASVFEVTITSRMGRVIKQEKFVRVPLNDSRPLLRLLIIWKIDEC